MATNLVLLGPQRPDPNAPAALAEALAEHRPGVPGEGPVVALTAGWQQDEADLDVLHRHLGPDVEVLPLYGWFEVVMRKLPELGSVYRARQDALIRLKTLHRVRLDGALSVVRELLAEDTDEAGMAALERAQADVRRIDAELLDATGELHRTYGRPWDEQPIVQKLQARAREILARARAIVVPGGHVAVLRNRLDFFGVGDALVVQHAAGTPVIAWSAGAMVLTERIVLFYDDPPEGRPSYPEILDRGFPLVPDLVMLPHARQRLQLDNPRRIALLTDRFAPATCLALENGAWLAWHDGGWANRGPTDTASRLKLDGTVSALPGLPVRSPP